MAAIKNSCQLYQIWPCLLETMCSYATGSNCQIYVWYYCSSYISLLHYEIYPEDSTSLTYSERGRPRVLPIDEIVGERQAGALLLVITFTLNLLGQISYGGARKKFRPFGMLVGSRWRWWFRETRVRESRVRLLMRSRWWCSSSVKIGNNLEVVETHPVSSPIDEWSLSFKRDINSVAHGMFSIGMFSIGMFCHKFCIRQRDLPLVGAHMRNAPIPICI